MSLRFAQAATLALAVTLGSCTALKTIAGVTVSQKNIAIAVQAFDAVEVSATQYLRLRNCADGESTIRDACRQPSVVPTLVKDVRAGRAARDSLWRASKGSPAGVGITAAYDAVVAATAAVKQDLSR